MGRHVRFSALLERNPSPFGKALSQDERRHLPVQWPSLSPAASLFIPWSRRSVGYRFHPSVDRFLLGLRLHVVRLASP
jgi:hypothetical protein